LVNQRGKRMRVYWSPWLRAAAALCDENRIGFHAGILVTKSPDLADVVEGK